MKKWYVLVLIILLIPFMVSSLYFYNEKSNVRKAKEKKEESVPVITEIVLTAAGDCTLGSDPNFSYKNSFLNVYDNNGPEYFFKGVESIFQNDDITVVNLENTFTESNNKNPKAFNFKAPAEYNEILKVGGVEIVNIANNHILDFNDEGYQDTINTLKDNEIPFFGEDIYYIYEINGIKIGFIGYYSNYNPNIIEDLEKGLNYLIENNVDLIITSFHWGVEGTYKHNAKQQEIGRFAIDHGADLVIGHHPHVVQDIEKYHDKYILYSLGNFSFGGNKNPKDKDTYIFQQKFVFKDKSLVDNKISIIPARVSSKTNINDYQPTILEGKEKDRVLKKILKYSKDIVIE